MSALALVVLLAVVSVPLADSAVANGRQQQEMAKLRTQIGDLRARITKYCTNVVANENLSKASYSELRVIFFNTHSKLSICMRCKDSMLVFCILITFRI